MDLKQASLLAGISSTLAIAACLIYTKIYSGSFYVDFSKIISPYAIVLSCLAGCTLMTLGYMLAIKWRRDKYLGWLHILYAVLSFAAIIIVLSIKLPLDIEFPELFPGLAIPMLFFPVLAFLTIVPFFNSNRL